MSSPAIFARALLLLFLIGPCGAQSAPPSQERAAPLTLDAYEAQLRGWSQQLAPLQQHPEEALRFRATLPAKSVVSEGGRAMEVSHSWLNTALEEFIAAKPERKPELLRQIQARLAAQGQEAELFLQPVGYPASARQKLSEILARREFRSVHGPTLWDQLKQRLEAWIVHWIERIFRRVSYVPHGGEILVWCAIGLGVIAVVIWLKRTVKRQIIDWPREPLPFAPSEKHWRRWLAEAREAAQHHGRRHAGHPEPSHHHASASTAARCARAKI